MEPDPSDENAGETGPQWPFVAGASVRPATALEAVMVAAAHAEPAISREERLPLRDIIVDALEELTAEQQWLFDALIVRQESLRAVAATLGLSKTGVARKRDRLLRRLRHRLEQDPQVREYLNGNVG